MKQTQRHNGIIELVKQQGYVSTEELVEHFSVSPQTIRRDLNELAEQNLILRHHGGAALPSSSVNTPWHDRKATQTEEKERIARKVAEQIPNGSTLFIDIGIITAHEKHAPHGQGNPLDPVARFLWYRPTATTAYEEKSTEKPHPDKHGTAPQSI